MDRTGPPRVGAPVLRAHVPLDGTPSARFHRWLGMREGRIRPMLERPTLRWHLLASFVEFNFMHPEVGPAGALALTHTTLDGSAMRRRAERLTAIPFRELAPYLRRWERGRR